jgi:hypothetical protein
MRSVGRRLLDRLHHPGGHPQRISHLHRSRKRPERDHNCLCDVPGWRPSCAPSTAAATSCPGPAPAAGAPAPRSRSQAPCSCAKASGGRSGTAAPGSAACGDGDSNAHAQRHAFTDPFRNGIAHTQRFAGRRPV